MKPFAGLTHRGQTQRLRRLAQSVLIEYPLEKPRLTTIGRGFNTTFRVDDATVSFSDIPGLEPNRYLLRVHRLHWHGAKFDTRDVVTSELRWLIDLRDETDLVVPLPVPASNGALVTEGRAADVPSARTCSLLRWVKGRYSL